MTRYTVDSDEVLGAQQTALTIVDRIQADSAALAGVLTGLQGSWTGTAAAAFQSAVAGWRQTQQNVEASAQQLHQTLGAAGRHYAEAELANAALFAR